MSSDKKKTRVILVLLCGAIREGGTSTPIEDVATYQQGERFWVLSMTPRGAGFPNCAFYAQFLKSGANKKENAGLFLRVGGSITGLESWSLASIVITAMIIITICRVWVLKKRLPGMCECWGCPRFMR